MSRLISIVVNLLLYLVSGRPKASATLARPRRRWLAAMSAATREAEQPGKEFQVAAFEFQTLAAFNYMFYRFTKNKVQSVCSCSLMFSLKVHCFKFLEFPSWMACVQEEWGATPGHTKISVLGRGKTRTIKNDLTKFTQMFKRAESLHMKGPVFCRSRQGHLCCFSMFPSLYIIIFWEIILCQSL